MGRGILTGFIFGAVLTVSAAAPPPAQKDAEGQQSEPANAAQPSPEPAKAEPGNDPAKADPAKEAEESATPQSKLPPMVGGAPLDPKAYIIGPEDVLGIRVWKEPELSGQFSVRPDGKISLPLIGETEAAGLTPEHLSNKVADGLSKFMTHPEVTVAVQQVNSKKYFIQGEVQKPGAFPLVIPTTVLEALSNAGGFRDFANTKKIIILRGTERFKFNYKQVIKGKNMEQNIRLQSGDQIIVP